MVFCLILWPPAGCACTLALLPVICLSGRVAARRHGLQIQGLADDPDGPEGAHNPLPGQLAPAVAPWSGTGAPGPLRPGPQMRSRGKVARCAADARARPRALSTPDTAPDQAIRLSAARSAALPGCRRRVAEPAGDGTGKAGFPAFRHRRGDPALALCRPGDDARSTPTGGLHTPAKRAG